MLRWSLATDRALFNSFWARAAPTSWPIPADDVTIIAEDVIGLGRVDIVILVDSTRSLGIEVKTREASTMPGQLSRYLQGLTAKYPHRRVAIAYLTPFDRSRAGDSAATLRSVVEFDEFAATFPDGRHLSWLDVAEVDWDGGELWEQHRHFVRTVVSSPARLRAWAPGGRSREFTDFFGVDAAELFDQRLAAVVGEFEGHTLPLARVEDAVAFADAFRVLIEADAVKGARERPSSFESSLQRPFLEGPHAEVHRALFRLADDYPNVWLQGRGNYGLRVAHPEHRSSGVSLLTSRGVDQVEIGKPR